MKHYTEKGKSRAPLPPRQKCPTSAGKQMTLLPILANLPALSFLLPSPAGLVAGPPPLHWGFLRWVGGNGEMGREVKCQQGLGPGSPSWMVGSTHGSRPYGQHVHGSCLLSERKSNRIGCVRPFPCGVCPVSCSAVPKLFVGLVFHQLPLCPPWRKRDVCKQNSGLLPRFRVLINLPSQGGTVTCITQ